MVGEGVKGGAKVTDKQFVEENRPLLQDIVDTVKRYQKVENWNALTILAYALNGAAHAIIEDVMAYGYIKKDLTLEDIIKH